MPFAGCPSLGMAFIISKYLLPSPKESIVLNLKDSNIRTGVTSMNDIDKSDFIMEQVEPEFTLYNRVNFCSQKPCSVYS